MAGGAKTQTSQNVNQTILSPEQRSVLDTVFPQVQQFAQTPIQLPQGSGVAGLNPDQLAAFDAARGQLGALGQTSKGVLEGLDFFTSGRVLDPNSNPYLADTARAAARPVTTELLEKVLPTLRSNDIASGQFGGSRGELASGVATGKAADTIGDLTSRIYSGAYQQGLGQMLEAFKLAPTASQLALLPASVQAQIGATQQQQQQAELTDSRNRFLLQQMLPYLQAKDALGFTLGLPLSAQVSSTTQELPQNKSSGLSSAIGGAQIGLALSGGNPIGAIIGGLGGFGLSKF